MFDKKLTVTFHDSYRPLGFLPGSSSAFSYNMASLLAHYLSQNHDAKATIACTLIITCCPLFITISVYWGAGGVVVQNQEKSCKIRMRFCPAKKKIRSQACMGISNRGRIALKKDPTKVRNECLLFPH